ncbi:MAG: hypothetical protein MZW92_29845 [Comamonadaceae bacterium]|nr:hypothetical protein [Comamonadaceae bacterium]
MTPRRVVVPDYADDARMPVVRLDVEVVPPVAPSPGPPQLQRNARWQERATWPRASTSRRCRRRGSRSPGSARTRWASSAWCPTRSTSRASVPATTRRRARRASSAD